MTNEQIVEKIRNGYSITDNMQQLYENNLPLIKRIIKPYTAYESIEDLLQEAYFGLWEAVQHYEISENVLFMTYAGYWIRQSVQRYIEKCGSVVKIPANTRKKISRYNKTVETLLQEKNRIPTDKEIADRMMISQSQIADLKCYSQGIVSLDVPINEDEDSSLMNNVKSDFNLENSTIEEMYKEHIKNRLWGIVERYTAERENHIIQEYFLHNKSMPQIAKEEHLTVQRIREIKENGLRKLRIGKAKKTLIAEFEIVDCGMFRNSVNKYNEHHFTSTVEHIALRRVELQEEYERKVRKLLHCTSERACL